MRIRNWATVAAAGALVLLVAVVVLAGHLPSLGYAVASELASVDANHLPSADELSATFEKVADIIRPSVVSISSTKKVAIQQGGGGPESDLFNDPFFQRFFAIPAPHDFVQHGLGTGVIVSGDGYILTNNHVADGADELDVRMPDDRTLRAKVVGVDAKTDLAVLKVNEVGLHPAKLGNSDELRVGQWVIAAGSPFGLTSSITAGIVSAKGRANMGITDFEDFIQTDAAINPGNSGGPLVDLHGDVVGINTAIFSRSGGYMGIGFAIPSNLARSVMNNIIEHGHVVRGWLGVVIQDLSADLASSFGYSGTGGTVVADLTGGGPGDQAGMRRGDIVVRFDGAPVKDVIQLRNRVAETPPGREVEVQVFRDGHLVTLRARIGEQPGENAAPTAVAGAGGLGLTLRDLTAADARQLGLPSTQHGVIATAVAATGAGERAGVQANDVIVAVQGAPVDNTSDFWREVRRHDLQRGVRLSVLTGHDRHYLFLRSGPVS